MLELLRGMIEEADDLPQPQLDALLSRLLPSAAAQAPAAHALVAALLQRTETTVQPYLQRFLKALLTGNRTDTELRDNAYELFYAVGAGLAGGRNSSAEPRWCGGGQSCAGLDSLCMPSGCCSPATGARDGAPGAAAAGAAAAR